MNTMLDQIFSLPDLMNEVFQTIDDRVRSVLTHELCQSVKRIFIVGCGDSHHAALGSELAFEMFAGVPVEPMTAMQFARYAAGFIPNSGPKTNLVIGISVSGSVARLSEALAMARMQGNATTIALTATPTSRAAQSAELVLHAAASPFPQPAGVVTPGIRSYFVNQLALLLCAIRIGEVRSNLSSSEASALRAEIKNYGNLAAHVIKECTPVAQKMAAAWIDAQEFIYVGAGPNFSTALFSAAKLLEASGDSAMGQDTEEWNHLQYFCRRPETPTIIISSGIRDASRSIETLVAAKAIRRQTAVIAPASATELHSLADFSIPMPELREAFSQLITSIPGELFAAYRSDALGETFFRGFGGGRSIEGGGGISRIQTSDVWENWQD